MFESIGSVHYKYSEGAANMYYKPYSRVCYCEIHDHRYFYCIDGVQAILQETDTTVSYYFQDIVIITH